MYRRLSLPVLTLMLLSVTLPAGAAMIDDFDYVKQSAFQFKDDAGSTLSAGAKPAEADRGRVMVLDYDIKPKGWAGWGLNLGGLNVTDSDFLSFMVKGSAEGEKFDIGLLDKKALKKMDASAYLEVTKEWRYCKDPSYRFCRC